MRRVSWRWTSLSTEMARARCPAVRPALLVLLAVCAGCTGGGATSSPAPTLSSLTAPPAATAATTSTVTTDPPARSATSGTTWDSTAGVPAVPVAFRLERRTADAATAGFEAVVRATLTDPRGWQRSGFAITFGSDAPYTVVLAEGAEVDRMCLPYKTYGMYSCQNGAVIALNADRWRTATPKWTGDLATYQQMLVNHEVGHLLGRHHPPAPPCPIPGRPALVMSQQSTELNGCLPNPWPLPEEIAAAARHDQPLAPPYEP